MKLTQGELFKIFKSEHNLRMRETENFVTLLSETFRIAFICLMVQQNVYDYEDSSNISAELNDLKELINKVYNYFFFMKLIIN